MSMKNAVLASAVASLFLSGAAFAKGAERSPVTRLRCGSRPLQSPRPSPADVTCGLPGALAPTPKPVAIVRFE